MDYNLFTFGQASMHISTIMLTGDDGYNAAGTRLLIALLRERYDLYVVSTKTQQSAVGGKISLASGFNWEETSVDGIPALCVHGTPGDATEIAAAYFNTPFDLAISGVNWGVNLGTAIFGSGTVNAALRTLSVGAAKKAISFSWDLPHECYVMEHNPQHDIRPYLEYPGKILGKLLDYIFANDFWGADLLNINLPKEPTSQIKFTKPVDQIQDIYDYDSYKIKKGDGKELSHFTYANHRVYNQKLHADYDVKAVTAGRISITPCKYNVLDDAVYAKTKGLEFEL